MRHVQIHQLGADLEPMDVFRQPAIADFGLSQNPLDHQERLFDLRSDLRLRTVAGSLLLTPRSMAMRFRLNEALGVRRVLPDDITLPAIRHIAPPTRVSWPFLCEATSCWMRLYVVRNQDTTLLIVVPVSKRLLFSVVKSACVPPTIYYCLLILL